jgi:hypothetical protein
VVETLDAADDIVIELQLLEAIHSLQVIDLDDVFVAE